MSSVLHRLGAAFSTLMLLFTALPSTAFDGPAPAPRLTAEERSRRGVDMVRYCGPQIAALARQNGPDQARELARRELLAAHTPDTLPSRFASALEESRTAFGQSPQGKVLFDAVLCMQGRAITLNADRLDGFGWITLRNSSNDGVSLRPGSGFVSCWADKGKSCTMGLPPGTYDVRIAPSAGPERTAGPIRVETGGHTVLTHGPR